MAGKAINQYTAFTGNPELVNILVQLKSQSDPNTFEHQKASLADMIKACPDVVMASTYSALPSTGSDGILYVVKDENIIYRWGAELSTPAYVQLTADVITQIIESGDTTHAPSADAVYTAIGDEATARANADSNLLSAIDNNSQRIENLEVAVSGSLVQTNTDATMANTKTITNANEILPWALLNRVGARAVAWNQLNNAGDFPNGFSGWGLHGNITTVNVTDHICDFICSARYGGIYKQSIPIINGHKYLSVWMAKGTTANTAVRLVFNGTAIFNFDTTIGTSWTSVAQIITSDKTGSGTVQFTDNRSGGWDKIYVQYQMIFDLTAMGMDTLTADQFRSKFPASYYSYTSNPSIIPLNPSAFKVVGKNKWDEQYRAGRFSNTTGEWYDDGNGRIASLNPIKVLPNTTYWRNNTIVGNVYFYGINGEYLNGYAGTANAEFTTPADCYYVQFNTFQNYGATYNHNIMICLNSVTDKTYESYKETTIDTSFTSDYKYVNENCHDYSENVLVDGVMRRKDQQVVDSVDLHDIPKANWERVITATADAYRFQSSGNLIPVKKPVNDTKVANIICSKLKPITANNTYNNVEGVAIGAASGRVVVYADAFKAMSVDDFYTAISSGYILNYELDSLPDPTYGDPIPNIPCEDGTTVTAVTPQTDLVNAVDVPSTIAYMTKISS